MFQAFGPDKSMQLYNRGIRRRLAPMLDNNRERLELAFSLLFTLPGTPMLQYGDEIGMGDDLSLPERECARTPMQWSSRMHGGFSSSRRVVRPVVSDPIYGYQRVNVSAQRRDPHSLLNWMERKIRMRRECPEISWGDWKIIETTEPGVLIMRYEHEGCVVFTLHNFTAKPRAPRIDLATAGHPRPGRPARDERQPRRRGRAPHDRTAALRIPLVSSRRHGRQARAARARRVACARPHVS